MPIFKPKDPQFESRVRASFARQNVMSLIGATLASVEPGVVEIDLPYREDLAQQHGFLHAGVITTIVDSACGYAALSVMPPETGVLSIEYKVNLLAPGRGSHFRAIGRVVRAGRNIVVCSGEALAVENGEETPVAVMLATMMVVRDRPSVVD